MLRLCCIPIIGHIANSIFLVTGGRKEPMADIFAGNQLETSIAVHTNHHSPSLVPYKPIILCERNLRLTASWCKSR